MSCIRLKLLLLILFLASAATTRAAEPEPLTLVKGAKRILFLGDSITAGGRYVAAFDAWIIADRWEQPPQVINMGLASETVSGLSEEGHAGGAFPRPDLAERLDRVLAAAKPDLVFACYGMNCGIYLPLEDARFAAYQQGMTRLKTAVEKRGAKLIVVTPPYFDALKQPKKDHYDGVLAKYSEWLLDQRKAGWVVIDLHAPMRAEVLSRREKSPNFMFAGDGVHPSDEGHWFIAAQIIRACGDDKAAAAASPEALLASASIDAKAWPLIERRMSILRDAYVSAAGHKRPGVAKGLPLEKAEAEAAKLTQQIQSLLK